MGGLFSSTEEPVRHRYVEPPRPTVSNYSYRREPIPAGRTCYESANLRNSLRNFESLTITPQQNSNYNAGYSADSRKTRPPVRVVQNYNRFNIQSDPYFSFSSVVTYIPLSEYDSEYLSVKRMVTNKQNFKIDGIEKIENPFLKKAYELKKEQKRVNYPYCEERLLFHGTTRANVDAICKFNFDWRLCKAHKYGKGVSFSPNSTYASCYSEKNVHNKVMIVAKVLIGRSCYGNEFMTLPDDGCDTSQKGVEAIVVVKYEDNEFLPVYKIKYHLIRENVGRRNHNRGPRVVNNYDFLIYD